MRSRNSLREQLQRPTVLRSSPVSPARVRHLASIASIAWTALAALLLMAAGCATITPTPQAAPAAEPTRDFASAVASIERRQAQDDEVAAQGARSVLLSH